jgi:hypothetical protein
VWVVSGLSSLAVLAYGRTLLLPLISDDYGCVETAIKYGSIDGWGDLLRDPLYRCRALSNVIGYWLYQWFDLEPFAYRVSSLFFHILNTFLVAALGLWKPIGSRVSLPAAAYFAVAEGHQEAVIWFAALPDLNVFTFTLAAFLAWVLWVQDNCKSVWRYALALGCFLVALLSKESAVALVGLQVLALFISRVPVRMALKAISPFVLLSGIYFVLAWAARGNHLHFNDGTFSLSAPFVYVVLNSIARMLWIWGLAAIGVLFVLWRRQAWPLLLIALVWAAITLLPYSFLTYMPRVPSRHTYLASVGLALLAGGAMVALYERFWRSRRVVVATVMLFVLLQNVSYIWTRKHSQFAERARPTEELISVAWTTSGPILVECFPFPQAVAVSAIRLGAASDPSRLRFVSAPGCENYRIAAQPSLDAGSLEPAAYTSSAP